MLFSVEYAAYGVVEQLQYFYVLCLKFRYVIDSFTSIMSILITTIEIMVLIYSDNDKFAFSIMSEIVRSNILGIFVLYSLNVTFNELH